MPALSSPRTRRRLFWLAGIVAVPRDRRGRHRAAAEPGWVRRAHVRPLGAGEPLRHDHRPERTATGRGRRRCPGSREGRPTAGGVVHGRRRPPEEPRAGARTARSRSCGRSTQLSDWQAGDHLPVSVDSQKQYSISTVLSFAGASSAGFVSAVDEEPRVSPESTLVAVRFAKQRGRWLVDYISQGHSSRLVDQSNYAPAGFLPGSHAQSTKDWAILILGFLAVVAIVRSARPPARRQQQLPTRLTRELSHTPRTRKDSAGAWDSPRAVRLLDQAAVAGGVRPGVEAPAGAVGALGDPHLLDRRPVVGGSLAAQEIGAVGSAGRTGPSAARRSTARRSRSRRPRTGGCTARLPRGADSAHGATRCAPACTKACESMCGTRRRPRARRAGHRAPDAHQPLPLPGHWR